MRLGRRSQILKDSPSHQPFRLVKAPSQSSSWPCKWVGSMPGRAGIGVRAGLSVGRWLPMSVTRCCDYPWVGLGHSGSITSRLGRISCALFSSLGTEMPDHRQSGSLQAPQALPDCWVLSWPIAQGGLVWVSRASCHLTASFLLWDRNGPWNTREP